MPDAKRECASCLWWAPADPSDGEPSGEGECRRHAPAPFLDTGGEVWSRTLSRLRATPFALVGVGPRGETVLLTADLPVADADLAALLRDAADSIGPEGGGK